MVAQTDASCQPRAVVVHLEHAAAACRAVVGTIRLARLTFLAEANLAVGFDGKGRGRTLGIVSGEGTVSAVVGGTTWWGEDGSGVGPVEESVEDEGKERRPEACYGALLAIKTSASKLCLGGRLGSGAMSHFGSFRGEHTNPT